MLNLKFLMVIIYLSGEDSWKFSEIFNLYNSSISNFFCEKIKEHFQKRISCIDTINNCMYCKNEYLCKKCNYGFSLFNRQCLPSINFQNNFKYYTPDNGINYYTCSSKNSNCEECSYDDTLLNKFHCSKCSNGVMINKSFECISSSRNSENENIVYKDNKIY